MKRKFSNRNEPVAELVAARVREKRLLRSSGLGPRVGRLSPSWITNPTDRESKTGPKLIKKRAVEKSTDVVPRSPAM